MAAKSPSKAEGVSEGPRAPKTALEMSAIWTLDSTGVQQRMLAPSQALGTQAQPNMAPPQTYEPQSLSPKFLFLVLRKANQNAVDVIRNLLQALKYGTGMMELEAQAERAIALMEKGVGRLNQLEAYQIGASKMLHKVLAEIADKERELAGAYQELGVLQEDLQDRSHELEGTEMKLARYVQQLKKSKMTAARLDGRLTFLMKAFESQNAFSKQIPSAQQAPAATEPADEATEGVSEGQRAPKITLKMPASCLQDSSGVKQRFLAPSQSLGTPAQPNAATPPTYEHEPLSSEFLFQVLQKANQNAKDVIKNLLQALKYGTRTVELGSQADRAVELLEKGVDRLNQLEAFQIETSKKLDEVLADLGDKEGELAAVYQELSILQEDLEDRSNELEDSEEKLGRYLSQLKKTRLRAARLDGDFMYLMREFKKQDAFSKKSTIAQQAPAASKPADEATDGNNLV
ncbi:hypothetical protein COCSUDRAFT_58819 [Coccomyxa subellipsoidea C-169]|uniref:Uncharacterized protein n=1 Tax=Coccomyxa subellipsoidea (strain C-169) TaxID=574566 RepID=I0Z6K9_COCSC|nr:hypothetical protein COCSUDRAFT_58819 [Coccomyxa subellipsoidea C-169]EIE26278.1 hypothetical protein COCSUDRAFT_58819 [Coccomyxa subellipsoidea C-169]|eukprot:XP_005650822.1 hypothetical protein COCSUDRAFT_58819 [Coccomyxa subellipsoidea C-169]